MRGFSLVLVFILLFQPWISVSDEMKPSSLPEVDRALFAGGCFWCMEPPFDQVSGVLQTTSGFAGGKEKNPSYEDVAYGKTGHREVVLVTFDRKKVSYEQLLEVFWKQIDPTDDGGQFVDRGGQYRSGIFYFNDDQKKKAERSKKKLQDSKRFHKPIVTEILKVEKFYPAEEYHQDFYRKDPTRYKSYRKGSGRDQFIEKYWPKSK